MKFYSSVGMIVAVAFLGMALTASAGTQSVILSPDNVTIMPDEVGKLGLVYNVTEGEQKTSGIGIRVFFNSNVFKNIFFEDVYGVGLIASDSTPQSDVDDQDNDPLTDKYISIAWVNAMGNWPNLIDLPFTLSTLVFSAHADQDVRPVTSLNVEAIDTAAGYDFQGAGAQVTIP